MERGRLGLTALLPSPRPRSTAGGALQLLFVLVVCGFGCRAGSGEAGAAPAPASRVEMRDGWLAMGTFFEVDLRVPAEQATAAQQWLRFAREEIARLEKIYSRHDPRSELSNLNRWRAEPRGAAGSPPLSSELARLLASSARMRVETGGRFDIALGPVVDLWTDAAESDVMPSRAALEAANRQVAAGHRSLDEGDFAASGRSRGRFDLDGISKGAVLDRIAASFVDGFPDGAGLLSFGQSSFWAIGDPDAGTVGLANPNGESRVRGWRLAIRSRDPARGELGVVRLSDRALSMSSSLGSVLEVGDERWSHVIDPSKGRPVRGGFESIVVADSAADADAWSTALLVWGRIPDTAEAPSVSEFEIWLMDDVGREFQTAGWSELTD